MAAFSAKLYRVQVEFSLFWTKSFNLQVYFNWPQNNVVLISILVHKRVCWHSQNQYYVPEFSFFRTYFQKNSLETFKIEIQLEDFLLFEKSFRDIIVDSDVQGVF